VPLASLEDARTLAGALRDMETKRANENDDTNQNPYIPRVAVVGGGYSGCELAGVVAERLKKHGARAEVDLFASSASGVLPSAPRGQRASAAARLERLGVNVVVGARATAVRGVVGDPELPGNEAEAEASSGSSSFGTTEPATRAALAWRGADGDERLASYDAVCWTVGQKTQCPPSWPFQRCDTSGKIVVDATLRVKGYEDVFAVGDVAAVSAVKQTATRRPGDAGYEDSSHSSPPTSAPLPSTAQVAFQQADYAAWNVWAAVAERPLLPFKYQHIGDMMTTGAADAAVALPVGDVTVDGVAGAALRRAAYLYRMPTDEHRARLAGAWLAQMGEAVAEKGAAGALEDYLGLEVPEELKRLEKMLPKPPGF
jgi:NADH:ubiquinone reductase (non-electrogenic)